MDLQILLRYHRTSNKGKRKVLTILSARLDSRQKMTTTKAKRLLLLNCCRLLSMMTKAISCSLQPMKVANMEWQDAHNTPRHS